MLGKLSICCLNVNGVSADPSTIKFQALSQLAHDHHIVVCVETRTNQVQAFAQQHQGLVAFQGDGANHRGQPGQGIAVFAHAYVAKQVRVWKAHCVGYQGLWLKCDGRLFGMPRCVLLGVVYIPPITAHRSVADVRAKFAALAADLARAQEVTPHVLVVGDVNAHVGSRAEPFDEGCAALARCPTLSDNRLCPIEGGTNAAGLCLLEMAAAHSLPLTTGRGQGDGGEATCRGSTRTEHFAVSLDLFCKPWEVCFPKHPAGTFDHAPIAMCFKECRVVCDARVPVARDVEMRLRWVPERRAAYAGQLDADVQTQASFHQAIASGQVDEAGALLGRLIAGAAAHPEVRMVRQACPPRGGGGLARYAPWFDSECKDAKFRLWQALCSEHAHHLHAALKREYKQLLQRKKRQFSRGRAAALLHKLQSADPRALKGLKPKVTHGPTPVCKDDWQHHVHGLFAGEQGQAADALDGRAESGHSLGVGQAEDAFESPDMPTWLRLARKHIQRLHDDTASGLDGIAAPFIKHALVGDPRGSHRHVLIPLVAALMACMFRKGVIPDGWKQAKLVPLHKKGDTSTPGNYRLLAINSVLYRVYANALRDLLTDWCVEHNCIPETQFGFYPGRNAQQAQFILRHLVHQHVSPQRRVYAVFVDFKQAYDTVDRQRLWSHMARLGVPGAFLGAIKGLYNGDTFTLHDGDKRCDPVHPTCGVKQGCPMSPLLFSLFISDIKEAIDGAGEGGVPLGRVPAHMPQMVSHLLYADDLTLLSVDVPRMRSMLCRLEEYADHKGLTVNVAKCKAIEFRSPRGQPSGCVFRYKGEALDTVEQFKYLGMLFSARLCMKAAARQWAPAMMGALRQANVIGDRAGVRRMPHIMLLLFQTFVLPYAMYASQVWSTPFLKVQNVFRAPLQSEYLGFVRHLLGVVGTTPGECVLSEACLKPLQFYWLRSCLNFVLGCHTAANSLLLATLHADVALAASCRSCWCAQLNAALDAVGCDSLGAEPVGRDAVCRIMDAWEQVFNNRWLSLMDEPWQAQCEHRQLATYKCWFKQAEDLERCNLPKYLCAGFNLAPAVVKSMACFRLGCHGLRVDRGRRNRVPYAQRVCLRCQHGTDDEFHMLFECQAFEDIRLSDRYSHLFQGPQFVRTFMQQPDWKSTANFVHTCLLRL